MKKFLSALLLCSIIALLSSLQTSAQGTCTATWDSTTLSCGADSPHGCNSGYSPQASVDPLTYGVCLCVCVPGVPTPTPSGPTPTFPPPGPSCDPATGVCRTGLGPITATPEGITNWALGILVGVAGGIALLFLFSGGLKWVTSAGDPKAVMEAKETVTAALSGLLLIVFSVLILKIIGYDILRLPGFGNLAGGGLSVPGT